ncbi:MAG: hypothetical protein SCH39_12560, partial [Methanosarcinales archaeon]|nr:hypothetical protein [Methanosarcinales archaeon]
MTILRHSDTDRDGLSDWYETVTDPGAKLYGSTDPLNRDSDNDGAIDGGESNVYPNTPIDIDNDGEVDSGKQMDLNDDGIIEMGEENYYETPPDEVTYFLDIFAVADQEYRDYYKLPWDSDSYKYVINFGVDGASVYFMEEFNVKLKVIEISDDVWNSDDAIDSSDIFDLLDDAEIEYKWGNNNKGMDTLIAFTGKDPYLEGRANSLNKSIVVQIPEIDDPEIYPYVSALKFLGIWPSLIPYDIFNPEDIVINYGIQSYWDSYLIQHEVSHIFEAYDYGLQYEHKEDPIS